MTLTSSESANPAPSQADLERLLQKMLDHPEAQDEIAAEVESAFGQLAAVLVLDMSGFSRTTRQHGIVKIHADDLSDADIGPDCDRQEWRMFDKGRSR